MKAEKIVQDLFIEEFKGFDCPFEGSETKLKAMNDGQRQHYYLQAKDLWSNEVLKSELIEWKRKLYTELALRSQTELERQGYRMTLIAIQEFEKRLGSLSLLYSQKPLQSLQDRL